MKERYKRTGVRREALAEVLRPLVERDGKENVAHRISASGAMTQEAATRRLWQILHDGTYAIRGGRRGKQAVVDLDVADLILQALDLTYVWQTDLAGAVIVARCSRCGIDRDDMTPGCSACVERRRRRRSVLAHRIEREAA